MIRIIKNNTVYTTFCNRCGSELEYDDSDIYPYSTGENDAVYMIDCPACGRKTVVS